MERERERQTDRHTNRQTEGGEDIFDVLKVIFRARNVGMANYRGDSSLVFRSAFLSAWFTNMGAILSLTTLLNASVPMFFF